MSKHITGHTGLLCLLGSPVAHSVSPEMHNEACDQLGLDYSYLAFDVPEDKMPQAVEGLRTMGARGWNITMPGKNIMCKLADKVSPASEISGACNTIVNDNGVLTAYTTDGVGFMRAVAENGVDIIGKKMTLLGAGGAATAILVQAALDGVAEINVFNVRDNFFGRAEEIVAKLNERTSCKVTLHDFSDPEVLRASIADSAILVNGTSVGMAPKTENTIITDTTMFHKDLFVFDVIYNPQETRLLREAKEAGCKTGNDGNAGCRADRRTNGDPGRRANGRTDANAGRRADRNAGGGTNGNSDTGCGQRRKYRGYTNGSADTGCGTDRNAGSNSDDSTGREYR